MPVALAWASLRRHTTRTLLAMLGVAVTAAMLLDMVMPMFSGAGGCGMRASIVSAGYLSEMSEAEMEEFEELHKKGML